MDLFYCLIFSAVPPSLCPNLQPPTVASHLYQLSRIGYTYKSPSSNNLFLSAITVDGKCGLKRRKVKVVLTVVVVIQFIIEDSISGYNTITIFFYDFKKITLLLYIITITLHQGIHNINSTPFMTILCPSSSFSIQIHI